MAFLKRLFGGNETSATQPAGGPAAVEDEAARDRDLLLEEAHRLDDDLIQRQLRYADRAWTPPAQGGARRAGDSDKAG